MWRNAAAIVIAILMMLIGGIWAAKANGWIGDAEPSQSFSMIGAALVGLGVALLYVVWEHSRRKS